MILVKRISDKINSVSGLILNTSSDYLKQGTVISVSEDIAWVKEADIVLFNRFAGREVFDAENQETLLLLKNEDIYLVNANFIPYNYVLINLHITEEELYQRERQVNSDIIKGLMVDTTYNPQNFVPRTGTVVLTPKELIYNNSEYTSWWDTDIEVQAGDEVYCSYFEILLALGRLINPTLPEHETKPEYIVKDGYIHVFIKYNAIIFAKRQETIIPVNGFMLVEPLKEKIIITKIELTEARKNNTSESFGRVAYIGKPLRAYKGIKTNDNGDIKTGDVVWFKPLSSINLEYLLCSTMGRQYYYMQRLAIIHSWSEGDYKNIDVRLDFSGKCIIKTNN